MEKPLPITGFYFINRINVLPVPGTGWSGCWGSSSSAGEDLGAPAGQQARHGSAVSRWQERLVLRGHSGASRLMEVVVGFCLALAGPHLKSCIQFWGPECGRDVGEQEGAKQRAPGLAGAGGLALREAGGAGLLQERWLCGDRAAALQYLWAGFGEDRAMRFTEVHGGRVRYLA